MRSIAIDDYVFDVLMRDLSGHDRKPSAVIVYLHLWNLTFGRNLKSVATSHSRIAHATGLSKSAVQAAVRHLLRRELISSARATPTSVPVYTVHRPWRRREK